MSGLYALQNDSKKEAEGIAVEFPANSDGTIPTLWVKPAGNPDHVKAQAAAHKPYARRNQFGHLSDEKKEELNRKAFVEGCIAHGANLQDRHGNSIEFTVNNIIQLFKEIPAVFSACIAQATEEEDYRVDANEAAAKN